MSSKNNTFVFITSLSNGTNDAYHTVTTGACGRAGEAEQALDLFRSMKKEGLSADRVAYNALFSALRVAGRAETVR